MIKVGVRVNERQKENFLLMSGGGENLAVLFMHVTTILFLVILAFFAEKM